MTCKVIAEGSYLPDLLVSNNDLSNILDTSDNWIITRTGIKQRYFASMSTFDMAKLASENLFANYEVDKDTIDLIIVTTCTAELSFPTIAAKIANHFSIKSTPALDINAVCSGFIYGID
ncbi:MAG: 3-oxoacyl-ACP synthase, partial [Rickettsiaceae bacterium]|nr:3-oxoacyl-ACP synthase [Rickettsiaceae bacterium]